MKKSMIAALITLATAPSWAVPIVNENVANSGIITIYPDHQDPHRYYVAPNVVRIATNTQGIPHFSYQDYRGGVFEKREGIIQMTLVPAYTRTEMDAAQAQILAKDPQAQFSGVPFVASSLELTGTLPQLISKNNCNHAAGLIGQEQACSLVLTPKGRKAFLRSIDSHMLFVTLQFEYSIQAMIRRADGSLGDQVINHGIAVRIDGEQLAKFPELIQARR